MVQVINDPTRGSVFGRLGKGIGQGLSEQLPQEVERYRLSKGLENLSKNSANLSPLQQASQYLAIPGISPAATQILPELLRQEGQRRSTAFQESSSKQSKNLRPVDSEIVNAPISEKQRSGLVNPQNERTALGSLQTRPQEQLWQEATELSNRDRFNFPTPADAYNKFVLPNEQTRVRNLEETINQGSRQSGIESKIENGIKNYATKFPVPAEIINRMSLDALERYKNKPDANIRGVLSEEQKKLESIAKDFNNLEGLGKESIFFNQNKTSKDSNRRLNNIVDGAVKGDYQDVLANQITADLKVSPGTGHLLAYPLDKNPKLKSVIESLDNIVTYQGMNPEVGFKAGEGQIDRAEATRNAANKIGKLINWDKDSLLGIARALSLKGYDPTLFMQEIKNKFSDKFNDRIRDESSKSVIPQGDFPNLKDIFMLWDSGVLNTENKSFKKRSGNELFDDVLELVGLKSSKKAKK